MKLYLLERNAPIATHEPHQTFIVLVLYYGLCYLKYVHWNNKPWLWEAMHRSQNQESLQSLKYLDKGFHGHQIERLYFWCQASMDIAKSLTWQVILPSACDKCIRIIHVIQFFIFYRAKYTDLVSCRIKYNNNISQMKSLNVFVNINVKIKRDNLSIRKDDEEEQTSSSVFQLLSLQC